MARKKKLTYDFQSNINKVKGLNFNAKYYHIF